MTEATEDTVKRSAGRPRGRRKRGNIELPDGEILQPLDDFAKDTFRSPRTVNRRGAAIVKVAGISYVKRNESLRMLADSARVPAAFEPTARGRKPR